HEPQLAREKGQGQGEGVDDRDVVRGEYEALPDRKTLGLVDALAKDPPDDRAHDQARDDVGDRRSSRAVSDALRRHRACISRSRAPANPPRPEESPRLYSIHLRM